MAEKKSPKTVRPAPKIVVTPHTPVSRYRMSIEDKMKQATMTQLINDVEEEAEATENEFETKPPKKYKAMTIPDISSWKAERKPKKVSCQSKSVHSTDVTVKAKKKNVKRKQPKPKKKPLKTVIDTSIVRNPYSQGDMVMTTARDIAHPAYTHGEISGSYIFLGAVTHIVPKDDQLDDEVNVHWMTISNKAVRYVDVQSEIVPYTAECEHTDRYVATGPVKVEKIKIVIRRDCSDLSLLNNFLAEAINDQYSFDLFLGWCKYLN